MAELTEVRARLIRIVAAVLCVLLAGTIGYALIEGWPAFDALYMTVITLATVGYGETHELSTAGRGFTIFLIIGGIGVMTYAFSTITSIIVEGTLSMAYRRRRMQKEISKLSGHYIICGAGRTGEAIIGELKKTGRAFVIIERSQEVIRRIQERFGENSCLVVEGDATEDDILQAAGVERSLGVFAALSSDQDNAFVALSSKGLNPRARLVSAQKGMGVREKLLRSGADNIVNPEFIGGLRMASEMIRPAATGFLDSMIRERDSVVRFDEIAVPANSPFIGRPVSEVKGAQGGAPLLIAVQEAPGGKFDINPLASRRIAAGERLVLLGEVSSLAELRRRIEG